jgi:hypothetical protein
VVALILICLALLLLFHVLGRWVRGRCEDVDFGVFGPRDTAPRSSS